MRGVKLEPMYIGLFLKKHDAFFVKKIE